MASVKIIRVSFFLLFIVFLWEVAYGAAPNPCSNLIISRASWGARPRRSSTSMRNPVPGTVIHHSAGPSCSTTAQCKRTVKGIQNLHMDTNKWSDIGYNFLVGGDGKVYEGRGWSTVGAHAPGQNSRSIGICVIGTFTNSLPPKKQLDAVKQLIQCGVRSNKIARNYKLYGHRDVTATACPGNRLYQEISKWPNKARKARQ